jgi:hypothetical protein
MYKVLINPIIQSKARLINHPYTWRNQRSGFSHGLGFAQDHDFVYITVFYLLCLLKCTVPNEVCLSSVVIAYYYLPRTFAVFRVIKSSRTKWAEDVARMGEMELNRKLLGHEGKRPLGRCRRKSK